MDFFNLKAVPMLRINNTTITIQIGNSIYNATIASTAPAAAIIKSAPIIIFFLS
jgi:hypothetical protein